MNHWWVQAGMRLGVALLLPVVVPCIIVYLVWAMPGDPASIVCPPESCSGGEALLRRWNLDQGPWFFFRSWLASAMQGELGTSWRAFSGIPVSEIAFASLPVTAGLVFLAALLNALGAVAAATRTLPRKLEAIIQAIGMVPALVFSLCAIAYITLAVPGGTTPGGAFWPRLLLGALVLGLSDACLSSTVTGVRSLVEGERRQRYAQMAVLRGEGVLQNVLPNLLPALAGQLRSRVLHLLSGAVVVEMVLQIDGLGDFLWRGAVVSDFMVVVAAGFLLSLFASALLLIQAVLEVATALHVRRTPKVAA
jgi:ABC-type dipeptide/oligopeptide/nickel transport system permease component